jgi:hypothetical protein
LLRFLLLLLLDDRVDADYRRSVFGSGNRHDDGGPP